jgi:hypothetical protein
MELLTAAFSAPNIIISFFLIAVLFYWLTVIVGAIDVDSFDVDIDIDADVDIHADINTPDKNVDVSAHGGNWFFGMLRFFNFGRVPFMVVMSILIISLWTISMICNHQGSIFNPNNSFLISLIYVVPNIIVSAFVMKLLSTPLIPIFEKLDTHAKALHYEGYTAELTTELKPGKVGQAKLFINNSSIVVSVKAKDGFPLKKGDRITILEENTLQKCYIVEKSDEPAD